MPSSAPAPRACRSRSSRYSSTKRFPQCSPSNTSPSFSTQANAAYYFRTVPPDIAIAPILADLVVGDGHTRISLIARADDWGQSLLHKLEKELEQLGAEYDSILYDPAAISFDAEVAAVESYDPDAVINITFNEGLALIRHLLEPATAPSASTSPTAISTPPSLTRSIPTTPTYRQMPQLAAALEAEVTRSEVRLDENNPAVAA